MEKSHTHNHSHKVNRKLVARMARIVGHAASVKTMIEEGRDCSQILIQIAAVRSALSGVGKILLDDHIKYCVLTAVKSGNESQDELLEELTDAIEKFVR
jgi:DNA-binding FrmR family transcriptional regulator